MSNRSMPIRALEPPSEVDKHGQRPWIDQATTLPELVQQIPALFRPLFGKTLEDLHKVAGKASSIRNTLQQLNRHQTEGSFPTSISGSFKAPHNQFSKEFETSAEGSTSRAALEAALHEARRSYLKALIEAKTNEQTLLQGRLEFVGGRWKQEVHSVVRSYADTVGSTLGDNNAYDPPLPADIQSQKRTMLEQGSAFWSRAVTLAHMASERFHINRKVKETLKKDTDVEMGGTGEGTQSIRQVVDEQIARALQSFKAKQGNQSKESSQTLSRSEPMLTTCNRKKRRETETPFQQQAYLGRSPQEDADKGQGRKRQRVRKEEVGAEVKELVRRTGPNFSYFKAASFPDMYTTVSDAARLAYHTLQTPVEVLETQHDFEPGVFKQAGVVLPRQIEFTLALNHKFILHSPPDFALVEKAFKALTRSIRIKWQFRDTRDTNYKPRFHVSNPDWTPELAAPHIELGILRGTDAGLSWARHLNHSGSHRSNIDWRNVQSFLESSMLLVKMTDKNLGLAVLTRDWYRAECQKHLGNVKTYSKIHNYNPTYSLQEILYTVRHDVQLPEVYLKYIEAKTKAELPHFYVIPKVHKDPWASRPIVPSHSWVTSRLSEVLDDLLRPLLKQFPWVIDSTKEFVRQLEALPPYHGENVWLVTGDVTAFYTNIPTVESADIIANLWEECTFDKQGVSAHDIRLLLKTVMHSNFFSFDGDVYHQIQGLAMGTSCSPLVANLYLAFYERIKGMSDLREMCKTTFGKIKMYTRYIDDIFFLFQGSKEALMHYIKQLEFKGLHISWNWSQVRQVFLDVELLMLPGPYEVRVQTRIYRKPMNKFLYIPWSSAHPLSVKKAFVKAELTRFMTICSLERYYAETTQFFYRNLRRRGYPAGTLSSWFKQINYNDRWALWLPKKSVEANVPLLIPSTYNEVWEYINIREVAEAMKEEWTKGECPDILLQPLIKSLSRSTNLGDLVSRWNVTILNEKTPVPSGNRGTLFDFGFTARPDHNPFFHIPQV